MATTKIIAPVEQRPAARPIEVVPGTPEQRLGVVRVIGAHGSFVLIETPSAAVSSAVPVGYLLHCHPAGNAAGSSTADLRVSPERRQPFVIADVLAGTPTVGDVAYLARQSTLVPVSRPSVIPLSSLFPASEPTSTPGPSP